MAPKKNQKVVSSQRKTHQNGVPGLLLVFLIMFTVSLILESESHGPERVQNFKQYLLSFPCIALICDE